MKRNDKTIKQQLILGIVTILMFLGILGGRSLTAQAASCSLRPSYTGEMTWGWRYTLSFDSEFGDWIMYNVRISGADTFKDGKKYACNSISPGKQYEWKIQEDAEEVTLTGKIYVDVKGTEQVYDVSYTWKAKKGYAYADAITVSYQTSCSYDGKSHGVDFSIAEEYKGYLVGTVYYGTSQSNINSTSIPVSAGTYYFRIETKQTEMFLATYAAVSGSFCINKLSGYYNSITTPQSKVYDGKKISAASVSGTSGNATITYIGRNGTSYNSTVPPTNAGIYGIYISIAESTNYKAISMADTGRSFTISQYIMSLSKDIRFSIPGNCKYNGQRKAATASIQGDAAAFATSGPVLSYVNANTGTESSMAPLEAGTYKVYLSVLGNNNYSGIGKQVIGTFSISKYTPGGEALTVQVPNAYVYCGETPSISATKRYQVAGVESSTIGTYQLYYRKGDVYQNQIPKEAGTYEIYYTSLESEYYYATSTYVDTGEALVISKANLPIYVEKKEYNYVYGDEGDMIACAEETQIKDSYEITYSSDDEAVCGVKATGELLPGKVGSAKIVVKVEGMDNYEAFQEEVTVSVGQAAMPLFDLSSCEGIDAEYKLCLTGEDAVLSDDYLPKDWSFLEETQKEIVRGSWEPYTAYYVGEDADCYQTVEKTILVYFPQIETEQKEEQNDNQNVNQDENRNPSGDSSSGQNQDGNSKPEESRKPDENVKPDAGQGQETGQGQQTGQGQDPGVNQDGNQSQKADQAQTPEENQKTEESQKPDESQKTEESQKPEKNVKPDAGQGQQTGQSQNSGVNQDGNQPQKAEQTQTLDQTQNPGQTQNSGNNQEQTQNPGQTQEQAQNPGNSQEQAQNPGNSQEQAQNPGNSQEQAQNPGNSQEQTQNSGNSQEHAQNPGQNQEQPQEPAQPQDPAQDEKKPEQTQDSSQQTKEDTKPNTVYQITDTVSFLLKQTKFTYDGKKKQPKVVVYRNSKAIKKKDYTLTYKKNIKPGVASVTIAVKTGEKVTVPYYILPAKTTIQKVVQKGKNSITVSWKKLVGVTGYELQYSSNKKFKKKTTIVIKKASTVKRVIKNLKKNQTVYVRVRGYKLYNKQSKLYGTWSKTGQYKMKS